jgi:hypothetical protein
MDVRGVLGAWLALPHNSSDTNAVSYLEMDQKACRASSPFTAFRKRAEEKRLQFHRSRSGTRFDLMVEGGWTTGRMVERYTKARPFEERRKAPSPFTASRNALKEKRPSEKWPSQKISGLNEKRTA